MLIGTYRIEEGKRESSYAHVHHGTFRTGGNGKLLLRRNSKGSGSSRIPVISAQRRWSLDGTWTPSLLRRVIRSQLRAQAKVILGSFAFHEAIEAARQRTLRLCKYTRAPNSHIAQILVEEFAPATKCSKFHLCNTRDTSALQFLCRVRQE